MNKIISYIVLTVLLTAHALTGVQSAHAQNNTGRATMFKIQAVDTMKYSRDASRDPKVEAQISQFVEASALMKPTHIAIGTPYDEEFYPIMKKWVDAIRAKGINVWYRGNFSAWEGWFGHSRFQNPRDHIAMTRQFILKHPELFEPGDIFTPAPEPENGGLGDPRMNERARNEFFPFLIDSYNSCNEALRQIGKPTVECGYFSTNGDVAEMFTRETVEQLGNVIVIDHYVRTPEELIEKITNLNEKTGAQIVLGEYGAPIPDIHGDLSFEEQKKLIHDNFVELAKHTDIVKGVNYWTAFGGSTTLFDGFTPRPAVAAVRSFFDPIVITGIVKDDMNSPLEGVLIGATDLPKLQTDTQGYFRIVTTADFTSITAEKTGYNKGRYNLKTENGVNEYEKNFILTPENQSLWHKIVKFFRRLFQ